MIACVFKAFSSYIQTSHKSMIPDLNDLNRPRVFCGPHTTLIRPMASCRLSLLHRENIVVRSCG